MAHSFNGTNQYLSASSTLLTNEPIDMVAHFNSNSATATQTILGLGNNGASGHYNMNADGAVAGDPVRSVKQDDAGTSGASVSSTGFATGSWYVASNTFINNTSRASYIDGGNKGTNATSITDPTPDFISVGALRRNAINQYFNGNIAEAYILDANMTDAQHAACGRGFSPLWNVPIKNVRGWYPLLRDDNNRMANGYPDLTPTNSPGFASHPANVIHPSINGLITI